MQFKRAIYVLITIVLMGAIVIVLFSSNLLQQVNRDITVISSSTSWPMFHHDLNHTGFSTSKAPGVLNLLWNYTTEPFPPNTMKREGITTSPAIADGYLYVGTEYGNVYCFNASNGEKVWSYSTGASVRSTPAVAGGYLYVASKDIFCLDALTGHMVWSFPTTGIFLSSPAIAEGYVYIMTYQAKIYCLNALTGNEKWSFQAGGTGTSSPSVVNGFVYIGSGDGNVNCFNADTGERIWQYMTGADHPERAHAVGSSPAVFDGFVYATSLDRNVYCLNASNGTKVWNYTANYSLMSSPSVASGHVYVASYCLVASTGEKIWNYSDAQNSGTLSFSSPSIAGDYAFFGFGNYFYCVDAATGDTVWRYEAEGNVGGDVGENSPAIANGIVYVTSSDGYIYAFG